MVAALTSEPAPYHRGELEMAVALHRIDEHRDQYPKPPAADAIGRLPQPGQSLMLRLVVELFRQSSGVKTLR